MSSKNQIAEIVNDWYQALEGKNIPYWEIHALVARLSDEGCLKQSGWISVEDRLPEENTDVLIYRGGFIGDLMNVYTYNGHNEWEDEYGYWSRTEDEGITHWMPLPEAPKMKSGE